MRIDELTMRFHDQLIDLPNLYDVIDYSPLTISPDNYAIDAVILMNQERSHSLSLNSFNSSLNSSRWDYHETNCILVAEAGHLLGIFTIRDVMRITASGVDLSQVKMAEVMTQPVMSMTRSPDQDIFTALSLLRQYQVHHLPILDDERQLIGIVTETSLLQAFDFMKMYGVVSALQQHLQNPNHDFGQVNQQIEEVRCQTYNYLKEWIDAQSAEVMQVNQELQQTLEELQVAEEKLRQQNEELASTRETLELECQRYQDLFEFAPDGYLVTDVHGVIQEANSAAATLLSVRQNYLIGKPLVLFVAEQGRHQFINQLRNFQDKQEAEIDIQPREGEPFVAEIKVASVYNSHGQRVSLQWLISNISKLKQAEKVLRQASEELEQRVIERTAELVVANQRLRQEIIDRQRTEQALQQSENLYRQLVESQTDLIIRIDLQGRVNFANMVTCETLGWQLHELRGQSLFEFFPPNELPQAIENLRVSALSANYLTISEQRLLTVNGFRWFQWNFAAIQNEAGEVVEIQGVGRDITDRKQIEEALQKSEEKFRLFADNAHAVIWIENSDPEEVLYVNQAYERIWGRSCQSLYNQPSSWMDSVHPEDRDRLMAKLQQHDDGDSASLEYRILRPDGSVRWIWSRYFAMHNEQGNIYAYGGIAEDITERKQTEESLRSNEERLSLALEAANMGIWDCNLVTNESVWSANNGPLYGLPSGTLCPSIEDYLNNFVYPEDREVVARYLDEGTGSKLEFRVVWPDGSIHWLSAKGQICYDEVGQPIRMIGTTKEISDRKQAEQQIREQAALLDVATDAILVRDFQTKILFWSQGAERLYGWSSNEALGKDPQELFYRDTLAKLEAAMKTVTELGSWQGELRKVTKSGQDIIVESRWTLVRDAAGQPHSILSVDTDITQKKQLEEQFFRTQRLESLGNLAGGISHDLNNILTPILAAAQLLQTKFTQDQERSHHLLTIIESNAKRGAALVKQVLSFARGCKGERTIVQIKHLIAEIAQIAKHTFPKSIQFAINLPENLWAISGDVTQLHQVLMNLVVNARDAMPDGGIVTISAENLFIDQAYATMNLNAKVGHYIVVTVADTGIGMPAVILNKIFDPFFTTKDTNTGTGLGLSTVLGIVKSHDGFINVSSKVGKGSEFKLFLPAVEATQPLNIDDMESPTGDGELILVVDDEAQILEITTITLEDYNYKTLAASNGIEAIALYAQHKHNISAVLMDMMMPEMDGMTAILTL
ncbi:PAS domain S-box protein [Atlanticothrix silvestris]|uniref:PAS domain S-box protein n=1 Tax=Atlanticothrix silvestris TaxID=2840444 RepID=UPI00298EE18A|nr:PAS domain S-box protein [Atlanticothrix silvestris]